jgi:exodeoxyribonuclease V alpha subunit
LVQGEAGTGKTSWISFLLTVLKDIAPNATVKLAAPTGKAARRITAITGHPAQTIHSLLGKGIEKNSRILYHYKKNPLDTDVLIIDEASMVNEYLWRDILWSVERGTKIVFVGDPNQLEPIGPGKPFADLIHLGFPTVTLRQNYRNDSSILALAKAIRNGEIDPVLLDKPGITFIPCETVEDAKEKLVKIYSEKQGKFPIVSMYREEFSLGIDQLNPFLKQRINPTGSEVGMGKNDPVIQICNTAKVDNGEVGIIQEFQPSRRARIIFEPAKVVDYTLEEMLENVELAYAITTTKTQGSQYEGVIIPLIDINKELAHRHSMWYKNSLYTAITRAQKELILIGDLNELLDGVKRKGVTRRTLLTHRITKWLGREVSSDSH